MNKYLNFKNYKIKLKSIFGKNYSKSYSQHGEDIILWNLCKSLGMEKPSYVDVGAFHPKILSNTYLFYTHGSRGITIEPNKKMFSLFEKERPKDKNLSLAISQTNKTAKYFVMDTPTLNTLNEREAKSYTNLGHKIVDSYMVETKSLAQIIDTYCGGTFPDILSLDTEGHDMNILQTIDWNHSKPKIICVETAEYSQDYAHRKNKELISWIENKGYIIYADTYINTIFVADNINKIL